MPAPTPPPGLGTITLFGAVVSQWWIAAVTLAVIAVAVIAIRLLWRRGLPVGAR